MSNVSYDPSKKFLNPDRLLMRAGIMVGQVVADLGAGAGYFSIAAGKIVGNNGEVFSVDVLESALEHVNADARMQNVHNIRSLRADLELPHSLDKIVTGTCHAVLMINILHQIKNKQNLFNHAYRLLHTGGKLLVVDWNDQPFPVGPRAEDRISEEQVDSLAQKCHLKLTSRTEADPYHYSMIYIK
jgi:ubiquinone/menaquinone biosynthesis C-methylase UbiE